MDLVSRTHPPYPCLPPPIQESQNFAVVDAPILGFLRLILENPDFYGWRTLQANSQEVFQPQRYLYSRRKFWFVRIKLRLILRLIQRRLERPNSGFWVSSGFHGWADKSSQNPTVDYLLPVEVEPSTAYWFLGGFGKTVSGFSVGMGCNSMSVVSHGAHGFHIFRNSHLWYVLLIKTHFVGFYCIIFKEGCNWPDHFVASSQLKPSISTRIITCSEV